MSEKSPQFVGSAARIAPQRPNPLAAVEQLKALLTNGAINNALEPLKARVDYINQELNRTHALLQTMIQKDIHCNHIVDILGKLRDQYIEALDNFCGASKKMEQVNADHKS